MANIAALDAHVRKLVSRVDRKFSLVFLAASGADNAAELPLRETENTKQAAASAVALLAEDAEGGLAIAKRAERMRVTLKLQRNTGADEFRAWLEKGKPDEILGFD